ncbi:translation initiation factor IF-2 N-terminal domain-containing protein [Nocardia arizonensis]|uniref:translation initiation factor IF-2 N-terminal domain-containing protein n=1 Tax=Nocardia arizonensis TaxID=1141647 RepID=UPI0006CF93D5|nr:translation initiation factor IF-2 N-terminal domain-containing protein [Nocardia arizonensis]
MADQEPPETTSQDADQLPERIRVHALAKRLGVTSKRILAKLTELGADARSAQSNVDRAVAESVRDALGTAEGADAASQPATAGAPAAEDTASVAAPVAEPEPEPTSQPGLIFSSSDSVHAGVAEPPPAPQSPVRLFTHAVTEEPQAAVPVVFESAVAAPLFLPPDATAVEEVRKQRRAEREARRAEEARVEEARVEEARVEEARVEPEIESEDDTETSDDDSAEQSGDVDGQPRRRRRGRRGRGRGRGEQHADGEGESDEDHTYAEHEEDGETAESAESDESNADDGEDEDESTAPEGSSRRRRRRRRRKVAGEGSESEAAAEDDPPNTVVHEREPRNKSRGRAGADEVQGITGSTRLEAKRQRRRDGREAGRRRPPILTESEFLARRESVDRVMVVREKTVPDHPTATQVAVLEDNILVEHFVTSTGSASMVGNVYLGRVQNVLPSMEAAFVDIGRGRNGVLYAGEVNWEAAGLGGKERKIEQALRPGDQVLVQVSKDPVGHKGARLTTQISLAGRFLVYVPGGTSTGISRKLPDTERKRLKEILRDIVPADAGVIIRTASEGVAEAELARDVERLQATWRTIEEQAAKENGAPKSLYEEPDLLVKVIRDLFNEDFSRLVIEGERAWSTVEKYIGTVAPDLLARVSRHDSGGADVFETYRIDEQLAKALDRKVWLPSGGTLVIDRTEAMTVIDVNTGKFTGAGGSNLEETVTRNNLEAAEEIVRQMRLRDIGGMIVVDFIDMVLESNRDLVLRRLTEALGRDRTRHQVSEVTSLGLVQMTRKKLGTGLVEAFSSTCEHCHGRGIVVHAYPVEPTASEDGSRKEPGTRRRRGRDKSAAQPAPAPAPVTATASASNGTAPAPEPTEDDAAVKRAHPVALAMAAHQHTDEDLAAADEAATVESAVVESVAETVDSVLAPRSPESGDTEAGARVVRVPAEAEDTVVAEIAADALSSGTTAVVITDTADAAEAGTDGGARVDIAARAEEPEAVAAAAASNGVEAARPARRRRVARSATVTAADSSAAVFVVSGDDQPSAPVVDFDEPVPAELVTRRPRRRAVGRPAGPPVED